MKGILILGSDKKYGSMVLAQYPPKFLKDLGIPESRVLSLFDQIINKEIPPQYTQMSIGKDLDIIEFYTGYSIISHVGRPNYEIAVLLSESDVIPKDFEGMLRRMAHDLLPQLNEPGFPLVLKDYFELLENGEIGTYWELDSLDESLKSEEEKEEEEIETNDERIENHINDKEVDVKTESDSTTLDNPSIIAAPKSYSKDEFEIESILSGIEDEEIRNKVNQLHRLSKESNEKINKLTIDLIGFKAEKKNSDNRISLLEKKIDLQKQTIEELSNKNDQVSEEDLKLNDQINELKEKIEGFLKTIDEKEQKVSDLEEQLREKGHEFENLREEYKEIDVVKEENEKLMKEKNILIEEKAKITERIENLKESIKKVKEENNLHLDTIASMKIEIKNLKENLTSQENSKGSRNDEIIELKKEVKVLRRERDHYKEIIKRENLLGD